MSKITLVTGLWDIGRGDLQEGWSRSFQHYLDKFQQLLQVDVNMIIFGDEELENYVLNNWTGNYRDSLLKEYNSDKMELINAFANCRDYLIENDLRTWIALNPLYPCVKNVLSNITPKILDYDIVTTKNARFVKAILESNQISPPVSSRLYDLEKLTGGEKPFGNKMNVLKSITNDYSIKNDNSIPKVYFVEDRYETLLSVASNNDLNHVDLYLADWGYNTLEQRKDAETNNRIKLLNVRTTVPLHA
jgi:phosphoglycolate phosphatase-like HAD superfamily hydrolase